MKTCWIISGGEFERLTPSTLYDLVIACDKGRVYAEEIGIVPDIIIGDFDSSDAPDAPFSDDSFISDADCEKAVLDFPKIIRFPDKKDDTDTMLAIKYALNHGYGNIIITCAMGGRFDHLMANIQSMAYVANEGGCCEILSYNSILRTFNGGSISLKKREGYSLSLFSLSDECSNLSIHGTEYEACNVSIKNTFPIGVSNYINESEATITMESGVLLIVESKLE